MVMVATVVYILGGSIGMFLGLALGNYFYTCEVYLIGVSLSALGALMIGTW